MKRTYQRGEMYYAFIGGEKSEAYEEYALYGGIPLVLTRRHKPFQPTLFRVDAGM